ncbi:hypothetical protein CAPTEDRAFT_123994 [Capitella teleta]|uniref:Gamma-aminobutyric acid type B receptor subunit 2 n=1 Tax=Capitella teleta TaxID=283909 RepID=R7TG04_CAPTE|nr:hypothetical protein CAPTEDRAFT_123994 [Capitella teleta]|eukprot:ELT92412.1 hypothetical protein CAPTEDRAFT_123994 [Capitella teleta]
MLLGCCIVVLIRSCLAVNLTISGLFPTTSVSSKGTHIHQFCQLSVEGVNQNKELLPGYNVNLLNGDSAVRPGIDAMYKHLYEPPTKLMIVGPSCSSVSQPVAEAAVLWNLTVVSYSATSPALSDRERYPRFFRTVAPDTCVIPARRAMMEYYGWNKIGTIHETYEIFTAVTDEINQMMSEQNWTIITTEVMTNKPADQIANLIKADARIIMAGFYINPGLLLMCEAYKQGLYGDHIVWFFMNWVDTDWVNKAEEVTSCTKEQLLEVLQGNFFTGPTFVNEQNTRGIAGITTKEFDDMYYAHFNNTMPFGSTYRMPAYDSVWAVALALNKTLTKLIESGSSKRLEDFQYSDIEMADMITESMKEVEFEGLEGYVKFDESGGVTPNVAIEQQRGDERIIVGWYYPATDTLEWVDGGPEWPGGKVPSDSSIIVIDQMFVSDKLYAALCLFASLGILQCVGFLIFNVIFRTRRVIKMSSPNINNIVLLGCVLCYSTVFFADVENSRLSGEGSCVIRLCTFVIGFSTAFGALFSKTWRVHTILTTSAKNLKKNVRFRHLVMMVLTLVCVDSLIIIIWQTVDGYTVEQRNLTATEIPDTDTIIIPQINNCSSSYGLYFTGALYVVQGLVMAFGAFLSWETRKVQVDALNDSKLIAMCIYNVALLSCLGAAINFVLDGDVNSSYGFVSGIIISGTLITSTIVFVPKVRF